MEKKILGFSLGFYDPPIPYYLGFQKLNHEQDHTYEYQATPMMPFRADGMLVWGVDATTQIIRLQVGSILALAASMDPIPALTFSAGYSFEEIKKLMKGPKEEKYFQGRLDELPKHGPWQECIARGIGPNIPMNITIRGPIDALVLWGWASVS